LYNVCVYIVEDANSLLDDISGSSDISDDFEGDIALVSF